MEEIVRVLFENKQLEEFEYPIRYVHVYAL